MKVFRALSMRASETREIQQFQRLRSRDLTTGSRNVCVGVNVWKNTVELSHQQDMISCDIYKGNDIPIVKIWKANCSLITSFADCLQNHRLK